MVSQAVLVVKSLPANLGDIRDAKMQVRRIPWSSTVVHSSTVAWRMPWTKEPGRLQSTGVAKGSDTTDHRAHMHNL